MIEATFVYERPTKRKVRFVNEIWGVKYVPNDVFEQLGRPDAIKVSIEPVRVELAVAA